MPRLLIAYDGSETARSAVRGAAGLFPGADAVVLFAHDEPPRFERTIVHSGTADPSLVEQSVAELANEITARATAIAEQGASLATDNGLSAEPRIVATRGGVWREVLAAAIDADAEV